jgi:hypothetical protein
MNKYRHLAKVFPLFGVLLALFGVAFAHAASSHSTSQRSTTVATTVAPGTFYATAANQVISDTGTLDHDTHVFGPLNLADATIEPQTSFGSINCDSHGFNCTGVSVQTIAAFDGQTYAVFAGDVAGPTTYLYKLNVQTGSYSRVTAPSLVGVVYTSLVAAPNLSTISAPANLTAASPTQHPSLS